MPRVNLEELRTILRHVKLLDKDHPHPTLKDIAAKLERMLK